ncbi:MAG TPA: cytochrome c biogenesis protein CcsA [Haliangiales bacterium]|nr:cytochrome c biogenesis protein CcsA [Haliangiales bacterium]
MKTLVLAACALVAVAGFAVLPFLVMDAPLAYDLYFNQKIFYYHVPAAETMFVSVFVSGIASIGYLATRRPGWDDTAVAAADLVLAFGAIMLLTGPIWAQVAWGTFWVWDARLTSSLLLWMIFVAYALIRRYGGPGSERLAAGLALFGMVDVPLVYFAVNFWRTQHPTNSVIPTLRGEMRTAFLVGTISYLAIYVVLLMARRGARQAERRLHDLAEEIETA